MSKTGSSSLYENINIKSDGRIEVEQHEDLNFQPPQGVSDLGNELEVHDKEEFDNNVAEETYEIHSELEARGSAGLSLGKARDVPCVMEQLQVARTLELGTEVEPQLQQVAYEGGATPTWPAEMNSAIPVHYQREIYAR
ncbi:hypothetical protein LWI28_000578 [Acer negundo]|uniref:Uncharacterized protein n=1 Tax=Acer negundo TaxID=4023 RepID=A0AAD5NFQ3_ACENE|nr:hypothetical protein LWI28_000578 [Acer negundo]